MSENATTGATGAADPLPASNRSTMRARWLSGPTLLRVATVIVAAVLPLYLSSSLLQTGLFCMSAVVGAIGLNLLSGTAGQVSLAHAFFLAAGAYGYTYFAGSTTALSGAQGSGLGLPTVVAAVLAVMLAGVLGLLFSPVSARLRGIYLGIASLALVFIGQQVLTTVTSVTGGYNGRDVPPLHLFGFAFADSNPPLTVLGVAFGQYERLWYVALAAVVLCYLFARNIVTGRPGSALTMVRDSEVAAAVMGVNVRRYKTGAFVLSSMYAGLAGVIFALTFSRIVPDTFSFDLSVQFVAMIVIGGLGSVGGAVTGAIFVIALPQLLSHYSSDLPFLAAPGSGGVDAGTFSRYVYGAAIIGFLIFEAGGLAAVGARIQARLTRSRRGSDSWNKGSPRERQSAPEPHVADQPTPDGQATTASEAAAPPGHRRPRRPATRK